MIFTKSCLYWTQVCEKNPVFLKLQVVRDKGVSINYVDKQGGRGWSNANDTKLYLSMKEIPQNPVNIV